LFLAQGLRNRDIATALWVSENTVKTHLKSIFQKTAVTSRAEAIVRISKDQSFSPKRHEQHGAVDSIKRLPRTAHPNR
jgi:predicted ArsR family transcriptional regulator